jgi:hypothetical protein
MATQPQPKKSDAAKPDADAPRGKRTPELDALEAAGKALGPDLQGDGERPKFGTARAAGPGPLPRVAHQLERAAPGQRRFKFRGENGTGTGLLAVKYVLAADEPAAEKCYRDAVKAADGDRLVCTALPD